MPLIKGPPERQFFCLFFFPKKCLFSRQMDFILSTFFLFSDLKSTHPLKVSERPTSKKSCFAADKAYFCLWSFYHPNGHYSNLLHLFKKKKIIETAVSWAFKSLFPNNLRTLQLLLNFKSATCIWDYILFFFKVAIITLFFKGRKGLFEWTKILTLFFKNRERLFFKNKPFPSQKFNKLKKKNRGLFKIKLKGTTFCSGLDYISRQEFLLFLPNFRLVSELDAQVFFFAILSPFVKRERKKELQRLAAGDP